MEAIMSAVTVSPKYQIVIPKEAREMMHLKPGQKLQVLAEADRILFMRVRDLSEMRGIYKGMDTSIPKEKEKY
jgi:AbrB family looped-hinge helix DNA binding protein